MDVANEPLQTVRAFVGYHTAWRYYINYGTYRAMGQYPSRAEEIIEPQSQTHDSASSGSDSSSSDSFDSSE